MGIMSLLSANCGTVVNGRFSGCKMSFGSDKGKFIDTSLPNQLLFIKLFTEEGRLTIADNVKSYNLNETMSGATLDIEWTNGEKSKINMPLQSSENGADPRRFMVTVRNMLETYCPEVR